MATQIDHSGLLHEASSQMLITQWDGVGDAPPVFEQVGITPNAVPLMLIQTHDRQGLPKPNAVVYITFTNNSGGIDEMPDSLGNQGYAIGYGSVYSAQITVPRSFFGGVIAGQPSNADGDLTNAETVTHAVTANPAGLVALMFEAGDGTAVDDLHILISSGGADIDVENLAVQNPAYQ